MTRTLQLSGNRLKRQPLTWTHEAFVASESDWLTQYEIKRRSDGAYGCSCTAFKFSKGSIGFGKNCKHLRAYLASGGQTTFVQRLVQPERPARGVKVVGETFQFRRAIAFGAIPTGGKG